MGTALAKAPRLFLLSTSKPSQAIASVLLAALICLAVTNSYTYYDYLVGAFFAYGIAAVLILQIRANVPRSDFLAVLTVAAAFFAFDGFVLHYIVTVRAIFSFIGLASLLVLGLRTIWSADNREFLAYCFLPALLLTVGMGFDGYFLEHSASTHAKTFDLYLYSADCSFGFQASYLVGQLFYETRWLFRISIFVYETCMVPLVLVYAVMLANRRRALTAVLAFLIAGPLGVVFFLLVPGTGPLYTFGNFPMVPLATANAARLALEPIVVNAPRNAIPSLHLTWALLAYWNTRRGPGWLRMLTLILLLDTALATLGTGQHYLVDLIAAVPFALFAQALATALLRTERNTWSAPLAAGLGLTLLWLTLVSFGVKLLWKSPAIPWALALGTIATVAFLYGRLRTAEDLAGETS